MLENVIEFQFKSQTIYKNHPVLRLIEDLWYSDIIPLLGPNLLLIIIVLLREEFYY